MLQAYRQHVAERAALGIPALPLSAQQTEELVALLKNPPKGEDQFLVDLEIREREASGIRPARGTEPTGVARKPAQGQQDNQGDATPDIGSIPPAMLRKIKVKVEQSHEGEGAIEKIHHSDASYEC